MAVSLDFFQGYMWFSVIYAILVLGYSIYLVFLNYRQAQVKKQLEKTNILLEKILGELEKKNAK